jgi:hypothetical protein
MAMLTQIAEHPKRGGKRYIIEQFHGGRWRTKMQRRGQIHTVQSYCTRSAAEKAYPPTATCRILRETTDGKTVVSGPGARGWIDPGKPVEAAADKPAATADPVPVSGSVDGPPAASEPSPSHGYPFPYP